MTDNEIKREVTFEERAEYFKKRYNEVWEEYKNPNGNEDPLYICVLRDGLRAIKKAEETINRQQAEIENYSHNIKQLTDENLILSQKRANIFEILNANEKGRIRGIKEFAERLKEICRKRQYVITEKTNFGVINKQYLQVVDKNDIDNLVKEMVGEE